LKLPFDVDDETEVMVGAVVSVGVALVEAIEALDVPPPLVAVDVKV
jgi:hypothetical protein